MTAKNSFKVSMAMLSSEVESLFQASPSPRLNFYRLYIVMVLIFGAALLLRGTPIDQVIESLVAISGVAVAAWFFATVYKLKALATPQNLLLMPNFKRPLVFALTHAWIAATTVLAVALLSPALTLLACVAFCLTAECKPAMWFGYLRKAWSALVFTGALFLLTKFYLSHSHGLIQVASAAIVTWSMIGIFLAAFGLACIFRAMGLIGFGVFAVIFLFIGIANSSALNTAYNFAPLAVGLVIVVAFVLFVALTKALASPSINNATKMAKAPKQQVGNMLTNIEDPFLKLGALLPTYDIAFNRAVARPFKFSALLGLSMGRDAHWHAFAKASILASIVVVFIYACMALMGAQRIDPNLKLVFYVCAILAVLGDSTSLMRPALFSVEMLAFTPRWPQAVALNRAYLKLSALRAAALALPTLAPLGMAWAVGGAADVTVALSAVVWVALFASSFSSRLQNFRSLEMMSHAYALNSPVIVIAAVGVCFSYFPRFLVGTACLLCAASCFVTVMKVRWFLAQSAILPMNRAIYCHG